MVNSAGERQSGPFDGRPAWARTTSAATDCLAPDNDYADPIAFIETPISKQSRSWRELNLII